MFFGGNVIGLVKNCLKWKPKIDKAYSGDYYAEMRAIFIRSEYKRVMIERVRFSDDLKLAKKNNKDGCNDIKIDLLSGHLERLEMKR